MKVMTVFGTRPEAIKMVPVIKALDQANIDQTVCVTGQHREMLDSVLEIFDVKPDIDLNVMRQAQTLSGLTARILEGMDAILGQVRPDWVLIHGDTTTTFATGLAAFYRRIRVGHVEAGLRSGDMSAPFPEELNRMLADAVSTHHYVPTHTAAEALVREGRPPAGIYVTGNTVIDALLLMVEKLDSDHRLRSAIDARFPMLETDRRIVLVTGHRRESFGEGFRNICKALRTLAARDDVQIIYPVHLNPNVRQPVNEYLNDLSNVHLIEPVDYASFVRLMQRSYIILTDSGGIQEEAPSINRPVLVMRSVTERPEAIQSGAAKLVGTSIESILRGATELLDDEQSWARMAAAVNPFGDGRAASRIASIVCGDGNAPLS